MFPENQSALIYIIDCSANKVFAAPMMSRGNVRALVTLCYHRLNPEDITLFRGVKTSSNLQAFFQTSFRSLSLVCHLLTGSDPR